MYLITGATGLIGRPLITSLLAAGVEVRGITRRESAALPPGVEAVPPEKIDAALQGVRGLFLHPRATKENAEQILRLAVNHGVEKVVVMSAINVEDALDHQPSRFNGDRNAEVERAVTESELPWVAIRPSSFAMNTLAMWRGMISRGDTIYGPFAHFAEAVIHEQDVADVIAQALLDDTFLGRKIPITGPTALRLHELVEIIGTAIGRPLRYQEIQPEAAASAMTRNGMNESFVNTLLARYQREMRQKPIVTQDVATALGRPARGYADWVTDHKDSWQ